MSNTVEYGTRVTYRFKSSQQIHTHDCFGPTHCTDAIAICKPLQNQCELNEHDNIVRIIRTGDADYFTLTPIIR